MNNLDYSIIYAVLQAETSEQLSLGLITVDEKGVQIKCSAKKLNALKLLLPEKKYNYISNIIYSLMKKNNSINSIETINYMTRYSNNLITLSSLKRIDLEPTEKNKKWLYRNYVYNGGETETA